MRPIAADAVVIKDGKILLVKRDTEPFRGFWALPGGRLEGDETLEQCCTREAKEESGIDVEIVRLIGIYSDPNRDPRKIITMCFLCRPKGGKESPQQGEISEVEWFPLDGLPPLASDHARMIKDALLV
ncbi:ADP-ribose pyrophosphatase [uncultured archaeon]|nr:ADP-ribose pyrophosphatase [uncultured archaeon]